MTNGVMCTHLGLGGDVGRILLTPVVEVPLERVVPAELLAAILALVHGRVDRVLCLVVALAIVCAREGLVALGARVPLELGRGWGLRLVMRGRGGMPGVRARRWHVRWGSPGPVRP